MYDVSALPEHVARKYVLDSDGHWRWTGASMPQGYGYVYIRGERRTMPAHRFTYEFFVGPIPDGLEIDHLCKTPCCGNPAHLEPVTHRENVLRGPRGDARRQQFCGRGHEKLGVRSNGGLYCLTCNNSSGGPKRPPRAEMTAEELQKVRDLDRRMRQKFPEEIAAGKKAWREANREHINAYQRAYRAARKAKAAEATNEVESND